MTKSWHSNGFLLYILQSLRTEYFLEKVPNRVGEQKKLSPKHLHEFLTFIGHNMKSLRYVDITFHGMQIV